MNRWMSERKEVWMGESINESKSEKITLDLFLWSTGTT